MPPKSKYEDWDTDRLEGSFNIGHERLKIEKNPKEVTKIISTINEQADELVKRMEKGEKISKRTCTKFDASWRDGKCTPRQ